MPSGAKKRRLAKKKKDLQGLSENPNSSVHSQGSDDVQHYTDKESDGGSPASQEHPNSEHTFAESDDKDVEKRVESLSGQLAVSEQSSQEVGVSSGENVTAEEGIVQIEWELKSEEDYGSNEGSIESKEVHTGGSSGSSSSSTESSSNSSHSSTDDDSRVKKKTELVETGHVDTFTEVAEEVDTSILNVEKSNAVIEIASVVRPDIASLIEDVVQINESSFGGYSVTPAGDILEVQEVGYKLEVQESADKILPDKENSTGNSPILMDLGLRKEEDKVVVQSEEKPAVLVDVNNSATEGKNVKLLLSFAAPTVHASKDADHIKASDSPKCSENQLVASAPQAAQKTSLKSCCGIFELFTSSDR